MFADLYVCYAFDKGILFYSVIYDSGQTQMYGLKQEYKTNP